MVRHRVRVARQEGPDWRQCDSCHLIISVGQPYHEGDKLGALLGWVEARFAGVHVTVADTLYRHNGRELGGGEVAETRRRGDAWLERNRVVLGAATIHRWDDWLAHPGYAEARRRIDRFLADQLLFAELVDRHVTTIVNRLASRGVRAGDRAGYTAYLVEELACMELFSLVLQAAEVYPGSLGLAMEGCRVLDGAPPGLLARRSVQVDFRRRLGPAQPQDEDQGEQDRGADADADAHGGQG
ncbi:tRNA-dependent cyclodipeptide synthase [Nonomuraea sp. NPDC050663]|uniref:tRNA-dependent cyclodipeptide synthase n=1 Tax=Nonomuraea sp. NPDC050663 TaxID=3364370 RepID=UPI0037AF8CE7